MFTLSTKGDTKTRGVEEGKMLKETLEKLIWKESPIRDIVSENTIKSARTKNVIQTNLPDEYEWIEAISNGALVYEEELYQLYAMELCRNFRLTPPVTSLVLCLPFDDRDKDLPSIGVNLDAPYFLHPLLILREVRPVSGLSRIEVSFITSAGVFLGINESGLSLALSLKPFEGDGTGYLPVSLVIREALKRCKDTSSAVRLISELPRGASGIISIADTKKSIVMEVTLKSYAIRETSREEFFASTQHFLGSDMMARDIPHDEIHPNSSPPEFSEKRIYSDSEMRMKAAYGLLKNKKSRDAQTLSKLLLSEKEGIYLSHGYYKTAISAVLTPKQKSIYLKNSKSENGYKLYKI
jgi:predicted choloylglycine hydrolase